MKAATTKKAKVAKQETASEPKGKVMAGVITSDKMNKTVVVKVDRYVKHEKYQKYYTISKKYKAHDEENAYKTGDKVEIMETRPISKDKKFIVVGKAA